MRCPLGNPRPELPTHLRITIECEVGDHALLAMGSVRKIKLDLPVLTAALVSDVERHDFRERREGFATGLRNPDGPLYHGGGAGGAGLKAAPSDAPNDGAVGDVGSYAKHIVVRTGAQEILVYRPVVPQNFAFRHNGVPSAVPARGDVDNRWGWRGATHRSGGLRRG